MGTAVLLALAGCSAGIRVGPGTLEFTSSTFSVAENAGVASITVTRVGGKAGAVGVSYSTTNGTATSGADYQGQTGTVSWGGGEDGEKTITIALSDDFAVEGNESFTISLSTPTGFALLGAVAATTVTIVEDDLADMYGLTVTNKLVTFNALLPGAVVSTVQLTGMQGGESLLGLDVRPASGALLALGGTGRLYSVDTGSGALTQVGTGTFSPALSGTSFGLECDPVGDRVRVLSELDQNLRVDPIAGSVSNTDTSLSYAVGDLNFGQNPGVTACAYSNNLLGATVTTAYGIDPSLDVLVRLGSVNGAPVAPSAGTLTTIGALGINATSVSGFDIDAAGRAWLSTTIPAASVSTLYRVDLATGACTLVGTIGGGEIIVGICKTFGG